MGVIKIGVVGAGIIGLSSALRIQQEVVARSHHPNTAITITLIAEKFSPETTGDGAAGIWGPYLLGSTPPENVYRWSSETHDFLHSLWQREDGGQLGVSMIPCTRVTSNPSEPEPEWKKAVYGFRSMTTSELKALGKPSLRTGSVYTTFTCECAKLLPHFLRLFKSEGGTVIRRRVDNLAQLKEEYEFDVLVNCTGLQSRFLVPDETVQPKRGQVMRVIAPGVKWAVLDDDDDGNYIIPNQDCVILGGTHQEGDWNSTLYPDDTNFIKKGCFSMLPSLEDAPVLKEWVGLRPGRPSVRLDIRRVDESGHKKWFLCNNYGHGGSGVTLFWGCAKDTADLVNKAVKEIQDETKSKL